MNELMNGKMIGMDVGLMDGKVMDGWTIYWLVDHTHLSNWQHR